MKYYRIYIWFLLITSSFFTFSIGQELEYKVLTKSGDVVLLNEQYKEVTSVNIGDILFFNDIIQVKNGGYIVLVDSNLQSIEISKAGNYNISAIDTLISIKTNSISKNITEFILNEMSTQENKNNEMKTLGAVVRKPVNVVEAACPKFGNIIDTVYNFNWYPLKDNTKYIFRLFNQNGNTIYMNEYNDTTAELNLNEFNLKYNTDYYWTISSNTGIVNNIDSITFKLLSPKQRMEIFSDIDNLEKDFNNHESSFNNFIIARYLISKELYETAISYMKKSIKLQPDAEFYWANIIEYFKDIGMEREAVICWNKSPFAKK